MRDCEGRVASGKRQVLDMVAGRENGLDEFNVGQPNTRIRRVTFS